MKKSFFLISMLCLYLLSYSQTISKDTLSSKFNIGFYPNLFYADFLADENATDFVHIFSCELNPYISYNVYNNLFLKCNLGYEFFYSDFYQRENFMEMGVAVRYIIPYSFNKKIIERFHLYFEFGYFKTNYRMVAETVNVFEYRDSRIYEDFLISEKLDQSKFSIPVGLTCHLTKKLYIDLNWQYAKYKNGTTETGFMCGLGYSIGQKSIR